jgi:hypothetical protein
MYIILLIVAAKKVYYSDEKLQVLLCLTNDNLRTLLASSWNLDIIHQL